jgi:hypothetical protein
MTMRSRARIDRRIVPVTHTTDAGLAAAPGTITAESDAGVDTIVFHDAWGQVEQRVDVAELRLPADLALDKRRSSEPSLSAIDRSLVSGAVLMPMQKMGRRLASSAVMRPQSSALCSDHFMNFAKSKRSAIIRPRRTAR